MSDLASWLEDLGLSQYDAVFDEHDIDLGVLPYLSDTDLKDIGVSLGHRRRLLAAISALTAADRHPPTATVSTSGPAVNDGGPDAERRHLTVMMCDLIGFTEMSERVDPEDLREIIKAYQDTCATAVMRFDGFVARYIGDGVLIYFGYPQAHEDDPERAARAGLDIVDAIKVLNTDLGAKHDLTLAVRVGIATGGAVVGDLIGEGSSEERAVVGDTPNLAARLQGLAEANTVVVSPHTRELIGSRFECMDLGLHRLKGIAAPIRCWRVKAVTESGVDHAVPAMQPSVPLVGREEEIGLLMRRWEQALDGECRVVVLSGEAGIGKSRILDELQTRIGDGLRNRVLYYGLPYYRNSAFYGAINQLTRALRIDRGDTASQRLDKLEAILADLGVAASEAAPALAELLSLPTGDRYPAPASSAEQTKQNVLRSLLITLEAMTAREPTLMIVEDVQWLDPSTREFIDLVIGQLQSARLLVVITCRPGFDLTWTGQPHVTQLTLSRLTRRESEALVFGMDSMSRLSAQLVGEVVERTDGIPLFIEELTKDLLESIPSTNHPQLAKGLAIPASLQDALLARLDRLGDAKTVAQAASVLGRSFSEELLAATWGRSKTELDDALDRLVRAELLQRRGVPPAVIYSFKHGLVRDIAYQTLLKRARRKLHQRVADVLESEFPSVVGTEPEVLAHHLTEAGAVGRSVGFWRRAGEFAAQRSATLEAVSHFSKGLEQLETLPEPEEYEEEELALRIGLGPALAATKGFGAPAFAENYERARVLCERVGDASHRFPVIWGLWFAKNQTGQIAEACALADELLVIGRGQSDSGVLLEAHHSAWTSRFAGGDLKSVLAHTREGVRLYRKEEHGGHALLYGGHDPGVCSRFLGGMTLCLMGHLDQAHEWSEAGVALAEEVGHQPSLALALSFAHSIHFLRREPRLAQTYCDRLSALCAEYGFAMFDAMSKLIRGWSLAAQSDVTRGLELAASGVEAVRATGIRRLSFQLSVLAEVLRLAGEPEKALEVVAEASRVVEETSEMRWAPDIYRLQGSILVSQGKSIGAEHCFAKALDLARAQEARLFELRASIALARLWRDQDRVAEAAALLEPLLAWFTEGQKTPDLIEGSELLALLRR